MIHTDIHATTLYSGSQRAISSVCTGAYSVNIIIYAHKFSAYKNCFSLFIAKAIISGDEIQYAVHGEEFEITCSVETTDSSIILTWDFMDGSFDAGNQAPIENGRRTNTLQFTVDASIHGGMITCDESKSGIDRSMDSIILIGMNHI